MLTVLIVLHALCGIQGKAFTGRYKRNYAASYPYIPYEEGIVRLPARYSPEKFQNYQDYINGYVQTNGNDWSVYYRHPVPSEPIHNPYSNANEHHKMKAKHTWHFAVQTPDPMTRYIDGRHQFESGVETPNVIEALVKKEVIHRDSTEYDVPIVEEALTRKDNMDHLNSEIPVVVDSLSVKEYPVNYEYDKIPVMTDSSTKHRGVYEHKYKESNLDTLTNEQKSSAFSKPVEISPVVAYETFELPVVADSLTRKQKQAVSYDMHEPAKKLIKNAQFISTSELEPPVVVDSLSKKNNSIQVKPVASYDALNLPVVKDSLGEKNKPNKKKPIDFYDAFDYPLEFNSLNEVDHDYETPIVAEALIRKEKPTVYMKGENETPVVVEALVRKHPPAYEKEKINMKENKILQKDSLHSAKKYLLTKEDVKNFDFPVVEALSFEQDIDSNETLEQEDIAFHEKRGFNEPEINSFDDTGDQGKSMHVEGPIFSKSFLPFNSNIFSMVTNVKELQRRKFKKCLTLNNETGNCMPFQLCSVSSVVSYIDELLRNLCIIDEVFLGVCCPEFPVETVRVDWEQLKPDTDSLTEEKSQLSNECGRLPTMVTDQNAWPWMALLIARSSDKIFCGGALIADQYVLTAAHCTVRIPRNQILIRLGRLSSENNPEPDFEVIEIKRHAGYNPRTMQNDIALLKLSRRVKFGDFRRVVCLAKDEEDIEGLVSEAASLLRWKETQGEIKDVEPLSVISNQDCQNKMGTTIADSIICTEPRTDETMCNADSGAPLIIAKDDKFEVIGVLTWNRNDCDERFPTVFTRVSSYHRWIEKFTS